MNSMDTPSTSRIFYTLMKEQQLPSSSPEYALLRHDEKKRAELEQMAEDFDCQIGWYSQAIYLIPNPGNDYLGYSHSDMRKRFSSAEKAAILYLRYFIILVLLLCFYDTKTASQKVRPFITLEELMDQTGRCLKQGSEQEGSGAATYTTLLKTYDNLSGEESTAQNTRKGLFIKVLLFLRDEKLILWDPKESTIRPLPMLDNKVDHLLRSDTYHALFASLKKGDAHADSE